MAVESFRDLIAWQRAFELTREVYRLTSIFPSEERFGLTAQLRRASVSIAGNIAEGSGRFTSRDFLSFLSHSRGSVKETESHLLVAVGVDLITEARAARALELTDETSRLLFGL